MSPSLVLLTVLGVIGGSFGSVIPDNAPIVSELNIPIDSSPVIIVLEPSDQNLVEVVQDPPVPFHIGSSEPEDFVQDGSPPVAISDVPDIAGKKPTATKPQKPGIDSQKPVPKPDSSKPQKPAAVPSKPQKPAGGKPQKPAGKPQKPSKPATPPKPPVKPQKPGGGRPQRPTPKPQRPSGKPNAGKPSVLTSEEVEEIDNSTTYEPVEVEVLSTTPAGVVFE